MMTIQEFSERLGISPHTVRYYEKLGLLTQVRRLSNGHRIFSEDDIVWFSFIRRLKDTGMPLNQILEYARLREKGDVSLLARRQMLEEHASTLHRYLQEQQQHLANLQAKIEAYDELIEVLPVTENCRENA
jgi:DNA-binding transcriptional MerR regulator